MSVNLSFTLIKFLAAIELRKTGLKRLTNQSLHLAILSRSPFFAPKGIANSFRSILDKSRLGFPLPSNLTCSSSLFSKSKRIPVFSSMSGSIPYWIQRSLFRLVILTLEKY